ncbi:tetratricopeptide repeat protein [Formosa sp. A9]|uniref:type IX secretion system periplasmic lipoprotein PorW/SprE n=1 Tax=Formosa sp. A9 TaxID=3442641 RepID=UPI003EB72F2D
MKTSFKVIFIAFISALVLVNCSRKKDKFISRNFHAMATEYNTLYNGYIALEEGRSSLNDGYKDNFWHILPVERLEVSDDLILPGESKNESFSRAEEKAVKAIQKHSMNIDGKEKNPQIDEAYLLLGQARYFDQRFIPALEAFNYILYKYALSDKINEARVWREKTNMRLDNNELAIKNLKRLLRLENLEDQELADATSTLAQAYVNTKSLDSAITQLEIAANATQKNNERGRYLFIKGQLYNALGEKDSANLTFDRVIEMHRKIPRPYYIGAYVEKAENFDYENGDKLLFAETLHDLEKNRENRPYLARIYHQIGEYYLTNNMDSLGLAYYNLSLQSRRDDKELNARNYNVLGDYYFDAAEYKTAGAYYDSTLTNLELNSKPYRTIKRERDNLVDVILYEDIATVNDSILNLVAMNDEERLMYFEEYTGALKVKAEAEQARLEEEARTKEMLSSNNGFNVNTQNSAFQNRSDAKNASAFYFYNSTAASYGKNEFRKIWGNRKNEDNWRWSNMNAPVANTAITGTGVAALDLDADIYQPQFYIDQIPSETQVIDSIAKERNYAYYQLGVIYKEKFSDYNRSKTKLNTLLSNNPEERLIVPAKYNLYKDYELLGQTGEANIVKNDIITNYPESRYAEILRNPDAAVAADLNSPEAVYKSVYAKFEAQNYQEVIRLCDDQMRNFEGDNIVAKFDLLKATAIGRLYGYEAYAKAVNDVALTYANLPEGQRAEELTRNVIPSLEFTEFLEDDLGTSFKVVYQFEDASDKDIDAFVEQLQTQLKKIEHYYDLKTSKDVYTPKITFVIVHGFTNLVVAEGFKDLFKKNDKNRITKPYFVISSQNYQTVQIHKNLESYLNLSK